MRKYIWRFLIIIFAVMLCGKMHAQEATDIKSVRADFVQEKHLKILAEPMISKGRLFYQAPGSLRWEYFSPVQSVLMVNDGETKRFIIKDKEIIEDSSASMQSMHIVMDEIANWLGGRFDENPAFSLKSKTEKRIVLTPTKESFSKIIQRIEIHLSHREGVIDSLIIQEDKDSFTKLDFENVILNEKLDDVLFKEI